MDFQNGDLGKVPSGAVCGAQWATSSPTIIYYAIMGSGYFPHPFVGTASLLVPRSAQNSLFDGIIPDTTNKMTYLC